MVRNLIPYFIGEQLSQRNFRGNITVCSLFFDISGFTSITERLMKNGKEGAEVVSDILKFFFQFPVQSIQEYGGFISTFAGDALTALFIVNGNERETALKALQTALLINDFFQKNHIYHSKFGDFNFGVKFGLAYGDAEWGIIGNEYEKYYFFRGNAVNKCCDAEHKSQRGEIWGHRAFLNLVENYVSCDHHVCDSLRLNIDSTRELPVEKSPFIQPKLSQDIIQKFIRKEELNFTRGEFREIVTVFISFENVRDLSGFMNLISLKSRIYGGSYPSLDFGDKAANILLFFGAPIAHENKEERALSFILSVKEEVELPIKLRVGMTKGVLYCGFNGCELRGQFTCLGNATNQAARFMTKAEWGEILTDESIAKNQHFHFFYKGDFQFKGRANKIPTYELIARKYSRKKDSKELFINRKQELGQFREFLKPLTEGKFGGIIYVHGNPGIGKTVLINKLKEDASKYFRTAPQWFYMPCDEILRKSFNPFIYSLREYFNQSEQNDEKTNKQSFELKLNLIREAIATLIKKNDFTEESGIFTISPDQHQKVGFRQEISNELLRTQSFIGSLLNLYWEDSIYEQVDPKTRYDNILFAIKNLIKAESLFGPVVIELEDAHWADDDTVQLLKLLTHNIENFPIVIICSCRYNDDGSPFRFNFSEVPENAIHLEHMDEESAEILMKSMVNRFPHAEFSPSIFTLIYQKTQGNPFFMEQFILYLQEKELLDENKALEEESFDIPSSINSIIIARIDRLSRDLRDVIEIASVLGKEFSVNILSLILKKLQTPIDKPLVDYLSEGENENIWRALREGKYSFSHELIRETVYEMQTKKRLRKLHKLAAEVIEDLHSDDLFIHYFDLANHYRKSEVREKAITYLVKAGDFAKKNYQNKQALYFYNKLLSILSDSKKMPEHHINTLLKKGRILEHIGKWSEAEQTFTEALNLSQKYHKKYQFAKAKAALGGILKEKGDYDKALEFYEFALNVREEIADKVGISRSLTEIGQIYFKRGDYPKALNYYERSLNLCEQTKDIISLAVTIKEIGNLYSRKNEYDKALEYYEKYLELGKKINDKLFIANAILNIGSVYLTKGKFDRAFECYNVRLQLIEEIGDKEGISATYGNFGVLYQLKGDNKLAKKYYKKYLKISEELENKEGVCTAFLKLGGMCYSEGNYEKAMDYFKKALKVAKRINNKRNLSDIFCNIATIYADTGKYGQGLEYYEKSLQLEEQLEDKSGVAIILDSIGMLYKEAGDTQKALKYYERAIQIGEELGNDYYLCSYLHHKANLLFELGNDNRALELAQKGLKKAISVNRTREMFLIKVLIQEIRFANGFKEASIKSLQSMLKDVDEEEQKAELYFKLYEYLNFSEEHRQKAITLYEKLYQQTPGVKYKNILNILKKDPGKHCIHQDQ